MKIIHTGVSRRLTEGQRYQLKAEAKAISEIDDIEWDILFWHCGETREPFERKVPFPFRGIVGRKFFEWLHLLHIGKKYDIVLQRRQPFDPFGIFFGWFLKNRYTIHHAKEIYELRLIDRGVAGRVASLTEIVSGRINARQVVGFVGVTREISRYQNEINHTSKPELFYPNGVDYDDASPVPDKRGDGIEVVMISGRFSEWVGLDILLDSVASADRETIEKAKLKIHLIGSLDIERRERISSIDPEGETIIVHGYMDSRSYREIVSRCDLGIAALALFRQGLAEGSTLKVRDYLSSGLAVYSGHIDASLPEDFPYFHKDESFEIRKVISFARKMKRVSREDIVSESRRYLDKREIVRNFIAQLREIDEKNTGED
jgi:glycosyltransferase involved in cell wall biosynthesis